MRLEHGLRGFVLAVLLAASIAAHAEDESAIALAEGPGRDQVRAACSSCHSLDYIVMNSPFLDRAAWQKTVDKMVKVMGAPLSDEQISTIVAYLDRHYGESRDLTGGP